MTQIVAFTGFPPGTFAFLRDHASNNAKAWFDVHRADHEALYLDSARIRERPGPRLQRFAPDTQFDPRVNGSFMGQNTHGQSYGRQTCPAG